MKCSLALLTLLTLSPLLSVARGEAEQSAKEALQALNDFIGRWKGSGGPDRPRDPKENWSETLDWGWRFKGDDVCLTLTVTNGRHFQGGELRFLPDKQRYQLTAVAKDSKKRAFEGQLKDEILTLEHTDPATKETQRLVMNLAGDGARFIYRYERRQAGRTLFVRDFQVACTKEGESLVKQGPKIECVVSGGLGRIAVSFKGM